MIRVSQSELESNIDKYIEIGEEEIEVFDDSKVLFYIVPKKYHASNKS